MPNWEFFTWKNGFRQIVMAEIPCNWFQCQENSIDPVHFEWTHSNWSVRLKGQNGPYSPKHVKVDFSEFEWGFQVDHVDHLCKSMTYCGLLRGPSRTKANSADQCPGKHASAPG